MTRFLRTAAAASTLALLLTACGPSISVRSDRDPSANIGAYKTFTWVSEKPMVNAVTDRPVSPLLEGRIMRAIRGDLEAKGYSYVDSSGNADFAVAFTIGSRETVRVDSYPVAYRGGWGWAGSRGYYGVSYGTDTQVRQYTKGALAIDMFDVASKSPVWHGVGEKNITSSDLKEPEPIINLVVASILAEFTP